MIIQNAKGGSRLRRKSSQSANVRVFAKIVSETHHQRRKLRVKPFLIGKKKKKKQTHTYIHTYEKGLRVRKFISVSI